MNLNFYFCFVVSIHRDNLRHTSCGCFKENKNANMTDLSRIIWLYLGPWNAGPGFLSHY